MKDRNISIAKGLGIVFVVTGHCTGAYDFSPFVPYSFHMPLFFFISGFLITQKHIDHLGDFVLRRCKSILLPYYQYYIFFGSLTLLLNRALGLRYFGENWYTPRGLLDSVVGGGNLQLYVSGWFLISLFVACCLFALIARIQRALNLTTWVVLVALLPLTVAAMAFGMSDNHERIHYILNMLVARNIVSLFFVWTGFTARQLGSRAIAPSTAVLFIAYVIQYLMLHKSGHPLAFFSELNRYQNLWTPFITSATGAAFVFALSTILARGLPANDWLERLGDNSLHVMAGHLAIFQLLNILFCLANGVPLSFIMTDGSLIFDWPLTWPLYVAAGLVIPVILAELYRSKVRPLWPGQKLTTTPPP